MSTIPAAKASPRIENGVLKWYEGDTFDLTIEITLVDATPVAIDIPASATITLIFYNERKAKVKDFIFTNIENNKIDVPMDAETSALFKRGRYSYDMKYDSATLTTIVNDNICVVE